MCGGVDIADGQHWFRFLIPPLRPLTISSPKDTTAPLCSTPHPTPTPPLPTHTMRSHWKTVTRSATVPMGLIWEEAPTTPVER